MNIESRRGSLFVDSPLRVVAMMIGIMCGWSCQDAPRPACVPGAESCPCTPLATCDDGLVCHAHECLEPRTATVDVAADGARACEALLHSGEGTFLADVDFGTSAKGAIARRGQRVSIAMISASDVDLTGRGVEVRWLGSSRRPGLEVESSTCFDRAGVEIPGSSVDVR